MGYSGFIRFLFIAWSVGSVIAVQAGCGATVRESARHPSAVEINHRKGTAQDLMDRGDFSAAIDALQPLADRGVKDSDVYAMIARCHWRIGDFEPAVANFEAALRIYYGSYSAHLDFALLLVEMGRVGRALTEFELAAQFNETDPLPHYNYGLALYDMGRREEALAQWSRAYQLGPSDPRFSQALGMGFAGVDDAEAKRYFERARELGANDPVFYNNFGLLMRRMGDVEMARDLFARAVALDDDEPGYRANLTAAEMTLGAFGQACPDLERLFGEFPENPTYRIYLGRCYLELGRPADAISLLEAWVNAWPEKEDPSRDWSRFDAPGAPPGPALDEACDVLAMAFRGVGQLGPATTYIRRAVALAPRNPSHLNNYGVILAEGGNIVDAKAQWRKVLEIEPDNRIARQNLSAIEP